MYIFMNAQAHKYAAPQAKDASDCLLPFTSQLMLDILEAAAPAALSDAVLADTITAFKNSPIVEQDEFYVKLQEKRDALAPAQ